MSDNVAHVLRNKAGMEVHVLRTGAVIQKIIVLDKDGHLDDVVLGFDDEAEYKVPGPYFGAVVGRVANRIAGAKFELDGKSYTVDANEGPNCLHGGKEGWHLATWEVEHADAAAIRLTHTSPDGDMGFPGTVSASVTYALTEDSTLLIDFEGSSDAATPINMAQHSYFNLDGQKGGDVLDHVIAINSAYYTHVGPTLIPTGEFASVRDTPYDLVQPVRIGERLEGSQPGGYDHNFVLFMVDGPSAKEMTKDGSVFAEPQHAVTLHSPASGRALELRTTAPGVQFYTGNFLDGTLPGKGGVKYPKHGALALETQIFPDAINQPDFPDSVLRPGKTYKHKQSWRFYIKDTATE